MRIIRYVNDNELHRYMCNGTLKCLTPGLFALNLKGVTIYSDLVFVLARVGDLCSFKSKELVTTNIELMAINPPVKEIPIHSINLLLPFIPRH